MLQCACCKVVCYSVADWAGSPSDKRFTSRYYVLNEGNLTSWRSKKQKTIARSSVEAKYRAMAAAAFEITWLKQLLQQIKFGGIQHTKLLCDNESALHIASNPIFHEWTNHIEIDCHFVREKVLRRNHHWVCQLQRSTGRLAHKIPQGLSYWWYL